MVSSAAMRQFLRSLIEPAPTSVWNPYRSRVDDRTGLEQGVDGFKLAFSLIFGFLVLVMTVAGMGRLSSGSVGANHSPLVCWTMVCFGAVVIFVTANRWAAGGPAIICVPALWKSFGILLFGSRPLPSNHYDPPTRTAAAVVLLFCVAVLLLTFRFIKDRPTPTTFIDRIALTLFVMMSMKQATVPDTWPPWPVFSGVVALLFAWCVYRWRVASGSEPQVVTPVDD
jgi:hypothetical protein